MAKGLFIDISLNILELSVALVRGILLPATAEVARYCRVVSIT